MKMRLIGFLGKSKPRKETKCIRKKTSENWYCWYGWSYIIWRSLYLWFIKFMLGFIRERCTIIFKGTCSRIIVRPCSCSCASWKYFMNKSLELLCPIFYQLRWTFNRSYIFWFLWISIFCNWFNFRQNGKPENLPQIWSDGIYNRFGPVLWYNVPAPTALQIWWSFTCW